MSSSLARGRKSEIGSVAPQAGATVARLHRGDAFSRKRRNAHGLPPDRIHLDPS
jgi:hypothetical protein